MHRRAGSLGQRLILPGQLWLLPFLSYLLFTSASTVPPKASARVLVF
jgi:hypothetical protein